MLFRKNTTKDKPKTRRTKTDDAELKELRIKARRRLIGALALVLAAFIVIPLLFDEPEPDQANIPVVVPTAPNSLPASPEENDFNQSFNNSGNDGASGLITEQDSGDLVSDLDALIAENAVPEPTAPATEPNPSQPETDKSASEPVSKPEPAKSSQPAKSATDERTDDGSVALALLEGKTSPAAGNNTASGNYHLQVAAYTTEQDANARRDKLLAAGVSNAYVESGQSNGQTVYRLRVGPFGSKQAVQAAQTRLRTLGYPNGLISTK